VYTTRFETNLHKVACHLSGIEIEIVCYCSILSVSIITPSYVKYSAGDEETGFIFSPKRALRSKAPCVPLH
jgi:hypothetical protein